jgi:hypothetical protein
MESSNEARISHKTNDLHQETNPEKARTNRQRTHNEPATNRFFHQTQGALANK